MSAIAQAIVNQIKSLPADEQREVLSELAQLNRPAKEPVPDTDPILSARGMFAGSRLTEALLARRAEERRRG
jgi:hypothetical protein